MSDAAAAKSAAPTVLSLAQLLEQQPSVAPASLVEPGLLPPQGILFVGGEPKVGKSLLVANLALSLAAGVDRLGFSIPARCRVLICQFELPVPQFVSRLALMRHTLGAAADQHLLVDTRASGHLLSAAQGLNHFISAARAAAAGVDAVLTVENCCAKSLPAVPVPAASSSEPSAPWIRLPSTCNVIVDAPGIWFANSNQAPSTFPEASFMGTTVPGTSAPDESVAKKLELVSVLGLTARENSTSPVASRLSLAARCSRRPGLVSRMTAPTLPQPGAGCASRTPAPRNAM